MAGGTGMSGDLALRVPMSWTSNATNAGFSPVAPWRGLSSNSTTQNVELEEGDPTSLLRYYRSLLNLRKQYPVLAAGTLSLQSAANDSVLRLTRESVSECIAIAVNFSSAAQPASLDSTCANATFTAILGATGTLAANASGDFATNVPGKAAVVYRAVR